jgi:hypothetical protein
MVTRLFAVAALILLLVQPSNLESCGPYFRVAVFTRRAIPENEKAFFSGKIGIVQPTWWRRYLAMSYRILSDIPLSSAQVASLLPHAPKPSETAVNRWAKARAQVPGTQPSRINPLCYGDGYIQYQSYGEDAFDTAAATLNERIRQAGADSAEVHEWLAAQDTVFTTCAGSGKAPDPAPPGSSPRIRFDRDYQIAAADFYREDYDEAKAAFLQIAANTASPWHTIAPYLAARADIRKGDYKTAQTELQALRGDPKAAALLDYVKAKLNPAEQLAVVGKRLLIRNSRTLAQDLTDYTFLYDKITTSGSRPVPSDEITQWIEAQDSYSHWQNNHSMPWLIAALMQTGADSPHAGELVEAARQVPFTSPAWPSARYHAIRLSPPEDARRLLTEVEPYLKDVNISTFNAFRAEQLKLARNLNEFLAAAPRKLAGEAVFVEEDPTEHADLPMFDEDALTAFNAHLPLDLWLASTLDTHLPPRLRTLVAQAGFARAVILDDRTAPQFAKALNHAYTDRFSAIFWMLHHPEARPDVRGAYPRSDMTPDGRIDNFRDNWWCLAKKSEAEPPAFLTPQQKEASAKQLDALIQAAGAPTFFATAVLDFAKDHPDDPRLPEALALAVKTSHFSCPDPTSPGPTSKAFTLLHTRFPNTTWARQTPYWYK